MMAFCEIENLMNLKEPADNNRMCYTFLEVQALSYFEYHLRRKLEVENSELPDNYLIELVIRDIDLEYIPKHAICVQKYDVRRGLYMGLIKSVQKFVVRLYI
jgi:hypothetical protein